MSSATGALKKQSEIGDNEEQQSARRPPAAATAGWQIIARETVAPVLFSIFLFSIFFLRFSFGTEERRAVWRARLHRAPNNFEIDSEDIARGSPLYFSLPKRDATPPVSFYFQ